MKELKTKCIKASHNLEVGRVLLDKINFRNKVVLDLCCGDGTYIDIINKFGAKQIIAVDVNKRFIDKARVKINKLRLSNVKLFVMDAHNLKLDDNYFDIVFCNMAFHHFSNQKKALGEIKRVLKKYGKLYINSPYKDYKNIFQKIKGDIQKEKPYSDYKTSSLNKGSSKKVSKEEMIRLLRYSGFRKIKVWVKDVSYRYSDLDELIKTYIECRFNINKNLPSRLNHRLWMDVRKGLNRHFHGKPYIIKWKMVYAVSEK